MHVDAQICMLTEGIPHSGMLLTFILAESLTRSVDPLPVVKLRDVRGHRVSGVLTGCTRNLGLRAPIGSTASWLSWALNFPKAETLVKHP